MILSRIRIRIRIKIALKLDENSIYTKVCFTPSLYKKQGRKSKKLKIKNDITLSKKGLE